MNLPIYINYFFCNNCDLKWKIFQEFSMNASTCRECQDRIRGYSRKIDDYCSNIRVMGKFECRCLNYWTSAYTWVLYFQRCFYCKGRGKSNKNNKVYPHALFELKENSSRHKGRKSEEKKHKYQDCAKCLEIGDCRYTSYENDDSYYYNKAQAYNYSN